MYVCDDTQPGALPDQVAAIWLHEIECPTTLPTEPIERKLDEIVDIVSRNSDVSHKGSVVVGVITEQDIARELYWFQKCQLECALKHLLDRSKGESNLVD